jgi:hypothetical protein
LIVVEVVEPEDPEAVLVVARLHPASFTLVPSPDPFVALDPEPLDLHFHEIESP